METLLKLLGLVLLAYVLVLWLSAVVWTYRDVRNRTTDQSSQMIAVLLVALFNLPGLIVYLVIRPQHTLADAYERQLESEAMLHEIQLTANSCQSCRRPIDDDFNICPHCRTVLREPCRSCARPVRTSWVACPYCASDRVPARTAPSLGGTPIATSPMRRPPRTTTRNGAAEGEAATQAAPASTRRPPVAGQS